MSHPYSESLDMQPEVSYIPYVTSSYEQTGVIIAFFTVWRGEFNRNWRQCRKYESMSDSIDELSINYDSDGGSIFTNSLEDIRDESRIHLEINARDTRFKISDCIRQTENEWKVAELSVKSMVEG